MCIEAFVALKIAVSSGAIDYLLFRKIKGEIEGQKEGALDICGCYEGIATITRKTLVFYGTDLAFGSPVDYEIDIHIYSRSDLWCIMRNNPL